MEPSKKKQKLSPNEVSSSEESASEVDVTESPHSDVTLSETKETSLSFFGSNHEMYGFLVGKGSEQQKFFIHAHIVAHHSSLLFDCNPAHPQDKDAPLVFKENTASAFAHIVQWSYCQNLPTGDKNPTIEDLYEIGIFSSCWRIEGLYNLAVASIVEEVSAGAVISLKCMPKVFKGLENSNSYNKTLRQVFVHHCAIMLATGTWVPSQGMKEDLWSVLAATHRWLGESYKIKTSIMMVPGEYKTFAGWDLSDLDSCRFGGSDDDDSEYEASAGSDLFDSDYSGSGESDIDDSDAEDASMASTT